jgi:hypothetical protein
MCRDASEQLMNFSKRKERPMKRILSTVLVFVVSLSLAGVAMAAAPKPPTSICLYTGGGGGVYALVVKPSSNIKMFDGTQKFYSIQGAIIASVNMPVHGSGYMEGNVFHFTFNSTYNISGTPYFVQVEGFWDVIAKGGSAYAYISASGNWSYSLSQVDCDNYDIVYSQENEGSPYLPPNQ